MKPVETINAKLVLIYVIISISIFQSGVDFQLSMFMYYPPSHRCEVTNQTAVLISADNCFYYLNESFPKQRKCTKWQFDQSQIKSTVVTEMSLVCNRRVHQLLLIPLRNISGIFAIFLGLLSDIVGRKIMFFVCCIAETILWILLGVIPSDFVGHIIVRFFKFFGAASSIIGFVLVSELTPVKYRNVIILNFWTFLSIGISISPLYVMYTTNWRVSWLIAAWPMIFYLFVPFILVESPKWLFVKNRKEEAIKVLKQLDQYSSDSEDDNFIEIVKGNTDTKEIKEFWKSGLLMSRLGVILFTSFSFYLVYQGTAANLHFFVSNIYVNAAIMGVLEIPTGILAYISFKYIGSVKSVVMWILIGIILFTMIPDNWDSSLAKTQLGKISHLILAILAKFLLVLAWNVIYVFYVGLFPTYRRNFVSNLTDSLGVIGSALGGFIGFYYINNNIKGDSFIANLIYGAVLLVAITVFGLIIPSIDNVKLPNSVEEAEMIENKNICCIPEDMDEIDEK